MKKHLLSEDSFHRLISYTLLATKKTQFVSDDRTIDNWEYELSNLKI